MVLSCRRGPHGALGKSDYGSVREVAGPQRSLIRYYVNVTLELGRKATSLATCHHPRTPISPCTQTLLLPIRGLRGRHTASPPSSGIFFFLLPVTPKKS